MTLKGRSQDKKTLAVFDFDGTISKSDTLPAIIRYIKGDLFFFKGMINFIPVFIRNKTGRLTNSQAKELLLSYFFKGMQQAEFQASCDSFSLLKLPLLLRKDALRQIKEHLYQNHRVIVISASCENWLKIWCKQIGIECIGTKLEIKDEVITGKFDGKNCNGQEKVNRLNEIVDIATFKAVYAYGDSAGDRQLLGIATHPNYRIFKN